MKNSNPPISTVTSGKNVFTEDFDLKLDEQEINRLGDTTGPKSDQLILVTSVLDKPA